MRIYEIRREERIGEICNLLNDMNRDGEILDKKKIIISIMAKFNVSRIKAKEYVDVAERKNELR